MVVESALQFLNVSWFMCTAPHFVNTVRQHSVEYFAGNIQPESNIPELNGYGCCYRNLCKPL